MSKVEAQSVMNGRCNGKDLWICDLRYNDYSDRPIRHVKPQLVRVRDNSETKKTIYYSRSFFSPLKKNGEPYAKVIAVVDNTGFRMRSGTAVEIFTTEEECRECYNEMVRAAIAGLESHRASLIRYVDAVINEYREVLSDGK